MKKSLFYQEMKKFLAKRTIMIIFLAIVIPSIIQFVIIKDGYSYYKPLEIFENAMSGVVAMCFPLIVLVYSDSYLVEHRNQYTTYILARISMKEYLIYKGIFNACISFIIYFIIISCNFLFYDFLAPQMNIIQIKSMQGAILPKDNTLTILLNYGGSIGYWLIYSLWVAINATLYSTVAYLLSLNIKNKIVSLSVPILIYHIGNFIAALLGKAEFSPLISIFPYTIEKQSIDVLLVPFFLILMLAIAATICTFYKFKKGELIND